MRAAEVTKMWLSESIDIIHVPCIISMLKVDEDLVCLGTEGHWPYSTASDSDKHLLV